MRGYNVAVVGALGAVGNEMIKILAQRNFALKKLLLLDVESNKGKKVSFKNQTIEVETAKRGMFRDIDIALFSAGTDASKTLAPIAISEETIVIDNSNAWRMDPQVPLVVPEVNPEALDNNKGLIANPNCSTIQMVVALKPLHDAYKIKRIVVSTYQAISGSGIKAINEINQQIYDYIEGKKIVSEVYPYQILFNAIPQVDIFIENHYTKEEIKMVNETHKILDQNINVTATAVRIPVLRSHSESINIETEKPIDLLQTKNILTNAEGVTVVDNINKNLYPVALFAEGKDDVFVGRIRRDYTKENALNLWVVSDNLRKGAALNAVQIAETMIKRNLI